MQYNKWEADGSICVQDSLSEVEPDLELEPELELELELELEDAHDSRVVRESLSESDTMPCGSKKLAAPSLYGWFSHLLLHCVVHHLLPQVPTNPIRLDHSGHFAFRK